MAKEKDLTDYGPLTALIGTWKGSQGIDFAPEPDGLEKNLFFDTITFTGAGVVENAEIQENAVVRYHQHAQRKSNKTMIHDQVGYLLWDPQRKIVTHTFVIPRGVGVVAVGKPKTTPKEISITMKAKSTGKNPGIMQAPFMDKNAKTTAFELNLRFNEATLIYEETTIVKIYGKTFKHTDQNRLKKVRSM